MVAAKHLEEHDPASDFQAGHVLGDRFRVERMIAAGGMGFVYMATDLEQQQLVALKIMRTVLQRDPIAIERFKREVRTIRRLMHPNTIELIDYGITEDGFMFLVMEWLHGKDLREILRIKHRLSPITATRVALQVCWSLSEAHMKGIIHRDLKPENIFIMHNPGPHLRIKVVDFGLAKVVSGPESAEQITRGGVVCGTPEYMSPEQAKGEKLDGRSDVYALGCVMYAMIEGDAPFRGKKALDVAMMHINNPFPEMSETVPPALREIIKKCVEKKASARFQDVNELANALESFLDPIECSRRSKGDAWTIRRSTPPEVFEAEVRGSTISMKSSESNEPIVKGSKYPDASEASAKEKRSENESVKKPFNSQCIKLNSSPNLQSHSRMNRSVEAPRKEGFLKRCLDRIL